MKTHITLTKYEGNQISVDTRYIHCLDELSPDSEGNLGPRTMLYYRMPEEALEFVVEESVDQIKNLVAVMEKCNRQAEIFYSE